MGYKIDIDASGAVSSISRVAAAIRSTGQESLKLSQLDMSLFTPQMVRDVERYATAVKDLNSGDLNTSRAYKTRQQNDPVLGDLHPHDQSRVENEARSSAKSENREAKAQRRQEANDAARQRRQEASEAAREAANERSARSGTAHMDSASNRSNQRRNANNAQDQQAPTGRYSRFHTADIEAQESRIARRNSSTGGGGNNSGGDNENNSGGNSNVNPASIIGAFGRGIGMGKLGVLGAAVFAGAKVKSAYDDAKENQDIADPMVRKSLPDGGGFDGFYKDLKNIGDGFGVLNVEAAKLAATYQSGSRDISRASIVKATGDSVAFAKGSGMSPDAVVASMAKMQMMGVAGANSRMDQKAYAQMVGEAIARSGLLGQGERIMESFQGYAEAQQAKTLQAPDLSAFASLRSAMYDVGKEGKLVGLTGRGGDSLISKMDSGISNAMNGDQAVQFAIQQAFGKYYEGTPDAYNKLKYDLEGGANAKIQGTDESAIEIALNYVKRSMPTANDYSQYQAAGKLVGLNAHEAEAAMRVVEKTGENRANEGDAKKWEQSAGIKDVKPEMISSLSRTYVDGKQGNVEALKSRALEMSKDERTITEDRPILERLAKSDDKIAPMELAKQIALIQNKNGYVPTDSAKISELDRKIADSSQEALGDNGVKAWARSIDNVEIAAKSLSDYVGEQKPFEGIFSGLWEKLTGGKDLTTTLRDVILPQEAAAAITEPSAPAIPSQNSAPEKDGSDPQSKQEATAKPGKKRSVFGLPARIMNVFDDPNTGWYDEFKHKATAARRKAHPEQPGNNDDDQNTGEPTRKPIIDYVIKPAGASDMPSLGRTELNNLGAMSARDANRHRLESKNGLPYGYIKADAMLESGDGAMLNPSLDGFHNAVSPDGKRRVRHKDGSWSKNQSHAWGTYGMMPALLKSLKAPMTADGKIDYNKITPEIEDELLVKSTMPNWERSGHNPAVTAKMHHDGPGGIDPNFAPKNETERDRRERIAYPIKFMKYLKAAQNDKPLRPLAYKPESSDDNNSLPKILEEKKIAADTSTDPVKKSLVNREKKPVGSNDQWWISDWYAGQHPAVEPIAEMPKSKTKSIVAAMDRGDSDEEIEKLIGDDRYKNRRTSTGADIPLPAAPKPASAEVSSSTKQAPTAGTLEIVVRHVDSKGKTIAPEKKRSMNLSSSGTWGTVTSEILRG